MQALARPLHLRREALEADRRIDEIAQHRLARLHVPGETGVERFGEKRLAEPWVALPQTPFTFETFSGQGGMVTYMLLYRKL